MEMRVASIGEILWDVIGGNEFLGGAPFNLCAHLARLGHKAMIVSAVGNDNRGERALAKAAELGIDTRFAKRTDDAPTGISRVVLDTEGSATHEIVRPAAYDFVSLTEGQLDDLAGNRPAWICYGTLTQTAPRPRTVANQLFQRITTAKRFYDVNLRPNCWSVELVSDLLADAHSVKLNEEEAEILADVFSLPKSFRQFCDEAARRFHLETLCITRGPDGCVLFSDGVFVESPGFSISVADTVGSGDAFSAALLHGFHQGWHLPEIAEFANRVGALVASRSGAMPAWTEGEARELSNRS
jgi:fructokinase